MCVAVLMVLLSEFNIGNFITGVLEGRIRAYYSMVHILQTGPPGKILILISGHKKAVSWKPEGMGQMSGGIFDLEREDTISQNTVVTVLVAHHKYGIRFIDTKGGWKHLSRGSS